MIPVMMLPLMQEIAYMYIADLRVMAAAVQHFDCQAPYQPNAVRPGRAKLL